MPQRSRDLERWSRKGKVGKLERATRVRGRDTARGADGATLDIGARRRALAVQLLGDHPGEEADQALEAALADPAPQVRLEALRGLVVRREDVVVAELDTALGLPDEQRDAAADVYAEWVTDRSHLAGELLEAYVGGEADRASAFGDGWAAEAWEAADVGGRREVAAEVLAVLLREVEHARARQVAAIDPSGVALAGVRRLGDPEIRLRVIDLLGRLRAVDAVEPLVDLLAGDEPIVRAAAATALGAIRHPSAVGPLMEATADTDALVRDAALDAVNGLGTAGTVWGMLSAARSGAHAEVLPPALPPAIEARPALPARTGPASSRLRRRVRRFLDG